VRFEELGDDGHADRLDRATARRLQNAGGDQRLIAPRHGAQTAGDGENEEAAEVERLVTDAVVSQPTSGITTAEVNRYPVETHSILSRLTPKLLIMCGSATLTMLLSRIAMNVPA